MPFIYKFLIDNEEVDVEIGFSTSRKWEEALDEASVVVPFSYLNEKPYKMFSLLEIEINEIDNYTDRNVIDTKKRTYLIYSDRVEAVGSYGYFRHNVSAIEYTAKLDYYFINQLAKSRSIIKNTPAPFKTYIFKDKVGQLGDDRYGAKTSLQNINIKETYNNNEYFRVDKVDKALVFRYYIDESEPNFVERDVAIRTTALNNTMETPHILSNSAVEWSLPKGKWEIDYGFIGTVRDGNEGIYNEGFNTMFKFYIEVIDNVDLTMYDIVNEIRDMVSKFGGIEDTVYYDTTRIFNIDTEFEELLKETQAPQIYLNGTTARQMLIYTLSFINALPRLEYKKDDLDLLTLEMYNLSVGEYETEDVVGFGSQQNTNQIGTKNYQVISQALSNNLDDASITTPSNNAFQTVRSLDVQITANNFGIKLPTNAPLYMPIKLVVMIPNIKVYRAEQHSDKVLAYEIDNFELDLTNRFINSEEWKLKTITDNFPNVYVKEPFSTNVGIKENKIENLSWNIGDTIIKLSDVYGAIFQTNLIESVVENALNEYFTLNLPSIDFLDDNNKPSQADYFIFNYTIPSDYKDWKFRVEYITDERLVIKQDKEDISQVSFYSEMRQNQEESLVDLVRQSKKAYGDLQRTGNIAFSFVKKHTKFSEFYEVGEKDKDDYTITQIDTQWFNDYALSTYSVTQYHNRIQQATFVNQKYRPFDNYTKNVLNRHEHYGDYLIAVPPDFIEILEQPTKIYSNDKTVRQISDILLGKTHKLNDNVSAALIRTDGMLEENPDGIYTTNFISTPVTSRGIKGGFAFTFGFSGNMVAGDGLVQKGSNWYNSAVRYTDKKGRFTRFGFMLLNELEIGGDDAYKEYPLLKIPNTEVFDEESDFHKRISFWCNFPNTNSYVNSLVWNKDPLTNASLTYQLNVLSYYMGLYVFGMSFFTENFIVKKYNLDNIENFIGAKLYIYKNNMKYALFEDIYIKGGYYQEIELNASNIEFNPLNNEITFKNINLDGVTSWAIGLPQKDGSTPKLLVACNENLNGIKFVKRHARPNVLEIGEKEIERRYAKIDGLVFEFNVDFAMNRIDSILFDLDTSLYIGEMFFEYLRSKDIGVINNSKLKQTISLNYVANYGGIISSDINSKATTDLSFVLGKSLVQNITTSLFFGDLEFSYLKSKDVGNTLNSSYFIIPEITYFLGASVPLTLSLGFNLLANMAHIKTNGIPLFISQPLEVYTTIMHTSTYGIPLDMNINTIVELPISFYKSKDIGSTLNYGNLLIAELLHYIGESIAIEIPTQLLKQSIDVLYQSSYGIPLSDNILINAITEFNIVIGKILEQTLNNGFILGIDSLDYRKSKDIGLFVDDGFVLTTEILHFIGESMPLTILIETLASVEVEHIMTAGTPLFFTEQIATSTNLIHISRQGVPLDMNLSSRVDVPVIFHKSKDIGLGVGYKNVFMTEISHFIGDSKSLQIATNALTQAIDILHYTNYGLPLELNVLPQCEVDVSFYKTKDIGKTINSKLSLTPQILHYIGNSKEMSNNFSFELTPQLLYVKTDGNVLDFYLGANCEVALNYWGSKDIGSSIDYSNRFTAEISHYVGNSVPFMVAENILKQTIDMLYSSNKGIPLNIDVISNCEIDMNFIKTHDIGFQFITILTLTPQLTYYIGDSQEKNVNIGYSYIQEFNYVISYGQDYIINANSQVEVNVGFWKTKDIGNSFELNNTLTYDLDFIIVKVEAQQLSYLLQMTYDLRYVTHKPKNLVLTLDSGLGISSDLEIQVVPPIQTVFNITTSKGTGVSSLAIIPNSYTRNDTTSQNFTISRTFATGYEENTATITRIQPYGGSTPVISGNSIIVYSKSYGDFLFTQTAKLKQYTITWNANGGTLSKISETIQHGKTPTAPTGTRTGYYLSGFSPTIYSANKDQTYIAQWTEGTYTPPPSAVVNCLNGTMYIDITNNSSQSEIIYINNVSYGLLTGNTTYRYYMEDWSGRWHPYSYDIKAGSSTTITVSGSQRVCISSY